MTLPIQLIDQTPSNPDTVVVPCFGSSDPADNWLSSSDWNGSLPDKKELYQVYISDRKTNIVLLGLGEDEGSQQLTDIFKHLVVKHRRWLSDELVIDTRHLSQPIISQCVMGLILSEYTVGAFKTTEKPHQNPKEIKVLVEQVTPELERISIMARETAEVVNRICALVDAPGNIKTPAYLGQWALESGKRYDYQVELLDHRELQAEKLQALLAVGQGSDNYPLMIVMRYEHPDLQPNKTDLGLVGKGVTFDTGGLSIKKATNMHYMKSDMGGAAAVLGATELIARLKLPLNVTTVIPVAENSVDARSIRPGDVIGSHSGKSIEVIDTDAEGRLILADGLSYIQRQYQPDVLVDLATLTGNCVAALGYEAAGLFSNNQDLARELSKAGEISGERVWNMPMWESYQEAMRSDIADIKNLSGQPVAGAITAAKFLEAFIDEQQPWAHLDIAGVAFGDTDHARMKSATGFGVRLLLEFAQSLIKV